jgi:ISXO2-like transposase domain
VKHKLLEVMTEREESCGREGRVEIDDAYLGGKKEGKRGRGSENKISFVAAVQTRDDGHPLLICLKRLPFTQEAIDAWANPSLSASSYERDAFQLGHQALLRTTSRQGEAPEGRSRCLHAQTSHHFECHYENE